MGFEQLFEPTRLLTFFFIMIRLGGIFFTAPIFSSAVVTPQVRMLLTIMVALVLAPFVEPLTVTDPNVLWLIFFGWEMCVALFAASVLCCITIIGIPAGIQAFKLCTLSIAPFGADITA